MRAWQNGRGGARVWNTRAPRPRLPLVGARLPLAGDRLARLLGDRLGALDARRLLGALERHAPVERAGALGAGRLFRALELRAARQGLGEALCALAGRLLRAGELRARRPGGRRSRRRHGAPAAGSRAAATGRGRRRRTAATGRRRRRRAAATVRRRRRRAAATVRRRRRRAATVRR